MALSRVDFPQALGPTITVKERSGMSTPKPVATVRWS